MQKKFIIALIIIILLGIGAYFLIQGSPETFNPDRDADDVDTDITQEDEETNDRDDDESDEEARESSDENEDQTVIGTSVEGRNINAYHFGGGNEEILLVGGIHGGYSWNTSLLAFETIDYFRQNPDVIPENLQVTVIPVLNPDGLNATVGTAGRFDESDVPESRAVAVEGRFNANTVDLNRNFDCEWESTGVWQSRTVDGGDAPFSEPESRAIRDYVESRNIAGAVVWYSAAGGVFSSSCGEGILPETATLTNLYASASGYAPYQEFNFYEITGDMVNWLAKENIPAISVLLSTHSDIEWNQNRAGLEALLEHYAN